MRKKSLKKLSLQKTIITRLINISDKLKGGTRTGINDDTIDSAKLTGCNGRDCF